MLTRLRHRARRVRGDAGITLIELLVAMGLSSIIGAMALSAFLVMNKASGTTVDRNIAVANARNVIENWTALLQLADSPTAPGQTTDRIQSVGPTEIVFFADIGNRENPGARGCPTKLDLSLNDNGKLVEQRTPFTDAACTELGTTSTNYLLGDPSTIVSTDGWLFTPYAANGAAVYTAPFTGVVRIDITFQVATSTDKATQTFTSTAALTKGTT